MKPEYNPKKVMKSDRRVIACDPTFAGQRSEAGNQSKALRPCTAAVVVRLNEEDAYEMYDADLVAFERVVVSCGGD